MCREQVCERCHVTLHTGITAGTCVTWAVHVTPPFPCLSPQVIARKYVATASAEGQWVLLQNTHLGLGYLAEVRGGGRIATQCSH